MGTKILHELGSNSHVAVVSHGSGHSLSWWRVHRGGGGSRVVAVRWAARAAAGCTATWHTSDEGTGRWRVQQRVHGDAAHALMGHREAACAADKGHGKVASAAARCTVTQRVR